MVSDITTQSALAGAQQSQASQSALAEDFSQFLTLLTTQLQNQDPLSPMDSTEFTNQLVAFTGVEQQINTNQKLDSMIALSLGSSYSEAQSYIGQEISYLSSEFEYTGAPAKVRYSLGEDAATSKIFVYNQFGEQVYSEDAAKSAGGPHEFTWSGALDSGGTAAAGTYEIRIESLDANENAVDSSIVVTGLVRGTESQNGQIFLLVGERAVALSNVLNTSQPVNQGAGDALTAALSYVGLEITYLNTEIDYDGSTAADVRYTLEADAVRSKILIYDENGELVFTDDVETDAGEHRYLWDGADLPAGQYQFVIDAIDSNDQRIPTSSVAKGVADGVETQNGQIFLNIGDSSISLVNVLSANVVDDDA